MITSLRRRLEAGAFFNGPAYFVVVIAATFLLAFGLGHYLHLDEVALRDLLPRLTVLALHACLLLLVVGFSLQLPAIRDGLARTRRSSFLAVVLLVLAAVGVSAEVVPRTNRILYDEHIYEGIAQSIRLTGEAKLCYECTVEPDRFEVHTYQYNKQPNGFPYFVSLVYRLTGISENSAHRANQLALAIGILSVLGIGWLLTRSRVAAFSGALAFAATPMVLWWSNTASADLASGSFGALAVLLMLAHAQAPSWGTAFMALGAAAWACSFRPESPMILAIGVLGYVEARGRRSVEFYKKLSLILLALALLLLPLAVHLHMFRNHSWGTTGSKFSIDVFWSNLKVNGLFYLNNRRFPAYFTVLAMIGAVASLWRRRHFSILLWFAAFWGIFLFFYAGSYEYGADVRYSLISAPPLAVLVGLGTGWLAEKFPALSQRYRLSKLRHSLIQALLVVLALAGWIKFVPVIELVGEEGSQARMDVVFTRGFATQLPEHSLVLSHNPTVWNMLGKSATQPIIVNLDRRRLERELFPRFTGGVYFHYGFWCNTDSGGHKELCDSILQSFQNQPLAQSRYRNYKYGLFRLLPAPPVPPKPAPEPEKSGRPRKKTAKR